MGPLCTLIPLQYRHHLAYPTGEKKILLNFSTPNTFKVVYHGSSEKKKKKPLVT